MNGPISEGYADEDEYDFVFQSVDDANRAAQFLQSHDIPVGRGNDLERVSTYACWGEKASEMLKNGGGWCD